MNHCYVKILLIEDNPSDEMIIKSTLKNYEYPKVDFIITKSLEQALMNLDTNQEIDLIICDLHLPDSKGAETVKILSEHCGNRPIIVVSNDNTDKSIEESIQSGAYTYIHKPTLNGNLKAAVLMAQTKRETIINNSNRIRAAIKEWIPEFN